MSGRHVGAQIHEGSGGSAGGPADVPVTAHSTGRLNRHKCRCIRAVALRRQCMWPSESHLFPPEVLKHRVPRGLPEDQHFPDSEVHLLAFRGGGTTVPRVCRFPNFSVCLAPWQGPTCRQSHARGQWAAAGLSKVSGWAAELIDGPWQAFHGETAGWGSAALLPHHVCWPLEPGVRITYLGQGPRSLWLCLGRRNAVGLLPQDL